MLDTLFLVCNVAVLPAWLLLAVAPDRTVTHRAVHAAWIFVALAAAYGVLLAVMQGPEGGGFDSLDGVATLLGTRHGALVGWIHYLVFDLFVGAWEVRDARRNQIHHGFVVPCLVLTLMLGPLGLATYLAIRLVKTRRAALLETPAAT
ncbi:MAG: DUF4281 domain-containing protein [Deltaproteobacteria bacterium]|jgi:hypothetical protein|nr:DUF4281 domain-containing protein [Deltaproteobacteria bacterium]MBW2531923.1 DUF4281 domain-containing protein [Deltaproteobacteria bacterium]